MPGEIAGLVGESGSGKSTLALALLKLLDHTGAQVRGRLSLLGENLMLRDDAAMRSVRGRLISLIPQSATAALNPALRLGTQLKEAWRAHSSEPWQGQRGRLLSLMESAGLPAEEPFLRRFPGQISVGQAQRVLIVMAILHRPPLLIADEPTSALDVITQREVLALLVRLVQEHQTGMLFISHDLLAVANVCHRLAILHGGQIVESGPVTQILRNPQHDYTKRLVAAVASSAKGAAF
jgi:ABC-type glutathione transport system ATPase component